MSDLNRSHLRNRLLQRLPATALAALEPQLELVQLPRGFVLCRQNEVISDVYFFEDGIASMIMSAPDGREVETGLVGVEGLGPVAAVLCAERTQGRIVMQVAGRGFRIGTSALNRVVNTDAAVRLLLMRYIHTLTVQIACTALFNATASIEERLARWLLMVRDRLVDDDMALTHEYLAAMLAVRRASVSTALHGLENHDLIEIRRGSVVIRNRPALERVADSAYGTPEAEYRRLFGETH